jgi:hypothetical protein
VKRIVIGTAVGTVAGIIDFIPMIIQRVPVNGCLSALFMWIVTGFIISTSTLKLAGVLKGAVLSLLILLPMTFIIAWGEPFTLVPIGVMTIILGGACGFVIEKSGGSVDYPS